MHALPWWAGHALWGYVCLGFGARINAFVGGEYSCYPEESHVLSLFLGVIYSEAQP